MSSTQAEANQHRTMIKAAKIIQDPANKGQNNKEQKLHYLFIDTLDASGPDIDLFNLEGNWLFMGPCGKLWHNQLVPSYLLLLPYLCWCATWPIGRRRLPASCTILPGLFTLTINGSLSLGQLQRCTSLNWSSLGFGHSLSSRIWLFETLLIFLLALNNKVSSVLEQTSSSLSLISEHDRAQLDFL